MDITYFERWFWKQGRGIGALDVAAALARHERSESYVAVVGRTAIIDLAADWTSVSFLDAQIRPYLRYEFKAMHGRLFLKGAHFWGFEGQSLETKEFVTFNFDPTGDYVAERTVDGEVVSIKGTAESFSLWAEPIEFGQYDKLLVIERGLPLYA